jgi:ABC-type bacteriocin/lantibiotic exporter with double-glycine peptidase domain
MNSMSVLWLVEHGVIEYISHKSAYTCFTIVRLQHNHMLSESVLFSGTLRYNLDPCGLYDDTQLWSAITAAHLKKFVSRLPGKLSYQVLTHNITTTILMSLLLLMLLCR